MPKLRPLLYLLPLIVCIMLLFSFSSQSYDQQTIVPFLRSHLNEGELTRILPNIAVKYGDRVFMLKWQPLQFLEFVFRKMAHLIMYATLAVVLFLALFPFRFRWGWKAAFVVLAIVSTASLDEWNQTMRIRRNGEAIDVVLDSLGGVVGLLICIAVMRIRNKRKVREQ
ncbi:VanZ family protein [Paenibacillus allorhizosphaerae]|uniref:VanZ-like domain-containing protein n=1 Tax=Paenibacillus allorhizosphaerae TaxID=2849866 RepID=A0ABN7TII2_9BACL|nr:VanZ family protein [Paenibacillus allorhizosphaerae]CAG7632358.1 hypothetical protein PAECIP111802_01837 [Paenibacillus allorhizosphaerae]